MSAASDRFRREMSADLPTGKYDMTQQTATIVRTPKKSTLPPFNLYGVWMVQDGDGYRAATAQEVEDMLRLAANFAA